MKPEVLLPQPPDTSRPVVSAFTIPTTSGSLTVPLSTFTATDDVAVTGYLVNETAATPSVSNSRWTSSAPTSYLALSTGTKTLYAWSKDGAGNVASRVSQTVVTTLPDNLTNSIIMKKKPIFLLTYVTQKTNRHIDNLSIGLLSLSLFGFLRPNKY